MIRIEGKEIGQLDRWMPCQEHCRPNMDKMVAHALAGKNPEARYDSEIEE